MLYYDSTTYTNKYIYGRFCTAHLAAALLVPMSASFHFHARLPEASGPSLAALDSSIRATISKPVSNQLKKSEPQESLPERAVELDWDTGVIAACS